MPAATATKPSPLPAAATADQRHHFDDGPTVLTQWQPNGQYTAIDADNWEPGFPIGWGPSRYSAICDLVEEMRERGWPAQEIVADPVEIERRAA